MKKYLAIPVLCLTACTLRAQQQDAVIHKGNELYKQKNYEASQQEYKKALTANPKDATANYNNGNAQYRASKPEDAVASYEHSIENTTDKAMKEKAFYNKGVALSKQQKLQESIEAWKESLKLDATDNEARENLQKALMELKKQQQQKNEENKDKKDKKQDQKQQQQEKPQQQQSKLNKQQVEQLLKALQQKEKEIQQKMQKGSPQPNKPEKDW
ncbi:MAG TPA: tetratricopeptide repeat protein [Chitinophagaceae bacterium]|nr:tetratricopeptide repeat protein [Chitinophagaceae bacterium]